MKYRQKEFTIFLTLGMTCNELKILLLIENALIFLIYVPIGLILGMVFSKIIVLFIFKISGIHYLTFQFKSIIYMVTVGYYALLTIIFILWTFKFVDNISVLNIVNYKNIHVVYSKKKRILKIAIFILIICYIHFNERMIINFNYKYYIDYSLICMVVIYMIFLISIKIFIVFVRKNKNFYYRKILLINEVEDFLKDNKIIIFFIAFLNLTFIISHRIYDLPNVKTFFPVYNIFRGSSFNLIYIFIVLLSFIASANIIYFKIKIDLYNWNFKKIKLYSIGLIYEEIDTILIYKLRLIFFSHVFLTTLTSILYIYILNINKEFMINTIKILVCYFVTQLLGYIITKRKVIEHNVEK
jgi:putative ABC transport system permease protein